MVARLSIVLLALSAAIALTADSARANQYATQVLSESPAGYWRMDEAGPGGPFTPIVNLGSALPDPFDGYLDFPGTIDVPNTAFACLEPTNRATPFTSTSNNRVRIADQPAYDFTNGLTISMLVNPSTGGGTLFAQGDPSVDERSVRLGLDTAGSLTLEVSRTGLEDESFARLTTDPIPLSQWSHVEAHVRPGLMELMVDGSVRARRRIVPVSPFLAQTVPDILIGNLSLTINDSPDALLDELAIFDGPSQGEQQTVDRYNALVGGGSRTIFGRDHNPLGSAALSNTIGGNLDVTNIGSSGADGVSVQLTGTGAESTGYSFELVAPDLEVGPARLVAIVIGVKIGGVPFLFAVTGVNSTSAGVDVITSDFQVFATNVVARVYDDGSFVGEFVEPNGGAIAAVPSASQLTALGSLVANFPDSGTLVELDGDYPITPASGGAALVGDTLTLTPQGFAATGFEIANADLIAVDVGTVTIIDEHTSEQPPPSHPGDIDGDGDTDYSDFLILSTNFNQMVEVGKDGDLTMDGKVSFADFLILSTNFNTSSQP